MLTSSDRPEKPVDVFDRVAGQIAGERAHVERNARGSLVLCGERPSVRAMTSRGTIVVRLDRQRVLELVDHGSGEHYKGQVNNWLVLSADLDETEIRRLVDEALSA